MSLSWGDGYLLPQDFWYTFLYSWVYVRGLNTRQVRIHLINNSSAVRSLTLVIVQDSQLRGHRTGVWEPILWIC